MILPVLNESIPVLPTKGNIYRVFIIRRQTWGLLVVTAITILFIRRLYVTALVYCVFVLAFFNCIWAF